jgi:hypothetical protein
VRPYTLHLYTPPVQFASSFLFLFSLPCPSFLPARSSLLPPAALVHMSYTTPIGSSQAGSNEILPQYMGGLYQQQPHQGQQAPQQLQQQPQQGQVSQTGFGTSQQQVRIRVHSFDTAHAERRHVHFHLNRAWVRILGCYLISADLAPIVFNHTVPATGTDAGTVTCLELLFTFVALFRTGAHLGNSDKRSWRLFSSACHIIRLSRISHLDPNSPLDFHHHHTLLPATTI